MPGALLRLYSPHLSPHNSTEVVGLLLPPFYTRDNGSQRIRYHVHIHKVRGGAGLGGRVVGP